MPITAGTTVHARTDIVCERCRATIHVAVGRRIPQCPHCGADTYVPPAGLKRI